MRIPISIVCVALTALLGMEAWTLNEIVDLKVSVAALSSRVSALQPKSAGVAKGAQSNSTLLTQTP